MLLAYEGIEEAEERDTEVKEIRDKAARIASHTLLKMLFCCLRLGMTGKAKLWFITLIQVILCYLHSSPVGGHLGVHKIVYKVREQFIGKAWTVT